MNPEHNRRISIITVVMNDLPGFEVTAQSILKQNNVDFEWIIVDGESSDGTWQAACRLRSIPGVKVLSRPRLGIYDAMNHALLEACGDWVWFINAGDFLFDGNCLADLLRQIKDGPNNLLITSPVLQITHTGYVFGVVVPRLVVTSQGTMFNFHHQGTLIPRKSILDLGLFDTDLKFAADSKMIDQLGLINDYVLIDTAHVGFKMGGRATSNYIKTLKEIRTHRANAQYPTRFSVYFLKNCLRSFILKHETNVLIRNFLKVRQKTVLNMLKQNQIKVPHNHLVTNENQPAFSCCIGINIDE